jgi:hypothetical protein
MKAKMLKIAGVKTEAAFYKKFPNQEAFMKVHGKEFKKAQMGTLIGGGSPTQSVSKPMSYINFQELYDNSDKLNTGSTQAERDQIAAAQAEQAAAAQAAASTQSGESGGEGAGAMGQGGMQELMKMFGGEGGGAAAGGEGMSEMAAMAARYGMDVPRAYSGYSTPDWFNNTTTDSTTLPPNKAKGFGIGAQTMGKMGGPAPVNQPGTEQSYGVGGTNYGGPQGAYPPDTSNPNWMQKDTSGAPYESSNINKNYSGHEGEVASKSGFTQALDALGPMSGPLGSIAQGYDSLRAERAARKNAQRDAKVSDITRMASATREEESKRRYVRPEDIQNTGEEFFPIYGVGTNVLSRNGGQFHRAQDGSRIGGNPTEIQNTYSNGYDIYTDGGYEPLQDPFQIKDFRHGGYLHRAQDGETGMQKWQNSMSGKGSGFSGSMATGSQGAADAASGGGTPYGAIGSTVTGVTQGAMGGQNAGGQIGGTIGKSVGSIFGPAGGMIGEVVGGIGGQLLDTNQRDTKKAQDRIKANTTAMALNSGFQGLQETHNRYVRNGGDIPSYEDGGYMNPEYNPQVITMFGDHTAEDFADYAHKYRAGGHLKSYSPPSERAMETYAMGGQLQTHWGGGAETMSHNPYMPGSGETVLFRGQSHTDSDGNGQTGIGITYGDNPVEVERGEPMFEMQSGGEINPETGEPETTGVVFGNMQIDKKVVGQFNDPDLMKIADIYHGKKFKNIGIDLAKQEAKQNRIIDKNSKLVDSFKVETSLDKAKLAGLQAMLEGADTKLRDIANTKITLANYQNAINDAKEELSDVIGQNLSAEDLAKGYTKLDKDPVTKNAKWGGNIVKKAQDGANVKSYPNEAAARKDGFTWTGKYGPDGKTKLYERTIEKFKTDESETKAADALGYVPAGQKQSSSGTWGKVTPAMLEEAKKANSWYPGWSTLNPKSKADVKTYQRAFNARAKAIGSTAHIDEDGDFGEQTVSARIDESKKSTPANTKETIKATVAAPDSTPTTTQETRKIPSWALLANQALKYFKPTDQSELDAQQLYPEFYAMASNQLEPVPAQSYQPELIVPYDISLQAQRNSVISAVRNREKQIGYNPAAQANAAPAEYNAINEINEKEFMANQALKNQVYTGNVNTMNEAKKINLGIFADQWNKQSQARSNTKATTQAALNSIADKYAKNKLENRKLSIYENMYNYRFGKDGRAQNYNGLQFFDTTAGGGKSSSQELPGYKATAYDANGNVINYKKITDKDMEDDYSAVEEVGKGKNGTSTKKNYKNSSVVRAFKNL